MMPLMLDEKERVKADYIEHDDGRDDDDDNMQSTLVPSCPVTAPYPRILPTRAGRHGHISIC